MKRFSISAKASGLLFLLFLLLVFALLALGPGTAIASPQGQDEPPPPQTNVSMSNQECLDCHQLKDMYRPLPNGDVLYLTIDPIIFGTSIHGRQGYSCTQCHQDFEGFPHPEVTAESAREFTIQVMEACVECHTQAAEEYAKGHHAQAFLVGNQESATCVDCHSAHRTKELSASHVAIAKTCETCHSEIYNVYKDSVHGAALLEELNPDVPVCSTCHENHDNSGPDDPGYVLFSPNICAKCHADEQLMAKYGIRTDVFDTYVADFHGTTVKIFEEIAPDQETNKPVCTDCHGVHDIRPPDDMDSSVMKDNLVDTCRRCHPDATTGFSDAWLSHYPPDLQHNTVVYLVNLFYSIIIPGTIGGMVVFIGTQVWRKVRGGERHDEGEGR